MISKNPENYFVFALPQGVSCIEIILEIPGITLENRHPEILLHIPKMRRDISLLTTIIKEKTGHTPILKSEGIPCTSRTEDDLC